MKKKTRTLGVDADNPTVTLFVGAHCPAFEFAKAFEAEGWSQPDVEELDLHHEWWVVTKAGANKSTPQDKLAVPCTVMYW